MDSSRKRAIDADSDESIRPHLEDLEEASFEELMKAGPASIVEHAKYTILLARATAEGSAGTVWIAAKHDMVLVPDDVLFSFGAGRLVWCMVAQTHESSSLFCKRVDEFGNTFSNLCWFGVWLLRSARWLEGKDAAATTRANSEEWYPFAITDATSRVLLDSRGLPPECGGLAGKLVEIGTAMRAVEASGAVNPGLSHHKAQKTLSGLSSYDVGKLRLRLALAACHAQPTLHQPYIVQPMSLSLRMTCEALVFGVEGSADLCARRERHQA